MMNRASWGERTSVSVLSSAGPACGCDVPGIGDDQNREEVEAVERRRGGLRPTPRQTCRALGASRCFSFRAGPLGAKVERAHGDAIKTRTEVSRRMGEAACHACWPSLDRRYASQNIRCCSSHRADNRGHSRRLRPNPDLRAHVSGLLRLDRHLPRWQRTQRLRDRWPHLSLMLER